MHAISMFFRLLSIWMKTACGINRTQGIPTHAVYPTEDIATSPASVHYFPVVIVPTMSV
jgi:hypothetical protein